MNSVQNPAYQAGMEARFAIAARHSRMVRVLRVAVPAAVILAMAAIVAVSIFNPFRMLLPKLPVDMGNLVVSGTKITMESPHLSGYTPDQRPYEVWAKTATQDVTDPDHVDLKTLRAKVLMEDQTTTITLDARNGLMDTKQQMLDLHKDIFLQSSTGYEARLSQALVDMGKGTVTSEEHVDVKLLNGTLTADRLRITGGGEVVRFEGNVVMNPGQSAATSDQPASRRARRARARRSARQDAVFVRQDAATRNDLDDDIFPRSTSIGGSRMAPARAAFALALIAAGDAGAQSAVHGRAQCDAGLFAESRPADPDRSRLARDARQEKGSDLLRQREGGAGRHHHDVEDRSWCSTNSAQRLPRRRRPMRRPRQNRRRCSPRPPVPAAVRRSGGWRRKATWS